MNSKFIIFILASLCPSVVYSQEDFTISEVTINELKLEKCELDSSASALILFDIGELKMGFSGVSKFTRHLRVKIFNKSSIDEWSNHGFLLDVMEQSVPKIKAATYSLNPDNKIEISELTQENIFKNKFDKYRKQVKFTMPNVKEGSIVDIFYSYNLKGLRSWQFQHSIPALKSQYSLKLPFELYYKTEIQGQLSITKFSEHEKFKGGIWNMDNVPAFKPEPYISASNDFISSLHFRKDLDFNDWRFIASSLLTDEDFGGRIFEIRPLKNLAQKLVDSIQDQDERVKTIVQYVKNEIEWDKSLSIYSYSSPLSTLKEKKGSSGDINLLLIALLNSIGINAQPVLISTRGNGLPKPNYPSLWQFNDVIGLVDVGTKKILVDGTNKYLNYQTVPVRCMNASGFVIGSDSSYWVPLVNSKSRFIVNANLELQSSGQIEGEVQTLRDGIVAANHRLNLDTLNYDAFLRKEYQQIEVNNYSYENLDKPDEPFKEKFKLKENSSQSGSETIYFNPIIIGRINENIFISDSRSYPLDFEDTYDFQYIAQIKVPVDYVIEDFPKSHSFSLPENAGKFSYQVQSNGHIINIKIQLSMNKRVFLPEEYSSLREFMTLIISKQAEMVVAKKKLN